MFIRSYCLRDLRLSNIVFLSLFLLSNFRLGAQVTCTASAPSRVEMGRAFQYTLTLNEQPSKITAVNFANFKHVGGPQTSSSYSSSFVNGQAQHTQSFSYTYILQPEKEGTFTIQGTEFVVNGNKIKSNPVTVTVVAGTSGNSGSSGGQTTQQRQGGEQAQSSAPELNKNDVFVKGSASKTDPYQGEQVIVTYKLYISSTFNGGYQINNINLPTQPGLWSYQLGDPNAEAPRTTEVVNNKQYTVFEIRRQAVFPQKSGEITITQMEIDFMGRVIYRTQGGGSFWDQFFGGGQQAKDYNVPIVSNTIKLHVKPLPEKNQPVDFSGLAGSCTIKSELSRKELKANDATNLTVTITGSGNIQHIEALNIQFPADFDVTDPKISDNIHHGTSGINGSRSFEYVIIPRSQGNFTIPAAEFSFFDLKTGSYKTLSTDEYRLKVEKGEGDAASAATFSNQKDIKVLDRDIRFIKTSDHAYRKIHSPFFASAWYFTLILSPLFLFIILLIIVRKQIEARKNIEQTKDRKANKVARKRLKTAHKLLTDNDTEAFYVEVSKVLWGYMSDKFHIPLSQLSMESVQERLQKKGLSQASIQEFTDTLQQCEFARFAPGDPEKLKHEMYDLTHLFITKIEKN